MEEKQINGKAIYTPKGAALEYGRIGCNFYTGCPHDCAYCYLKRGAPSAQLGGKEVKLKKCFKDEAHALTVFSNEVYKHLEQCKKHGIFLSFTADPLIKETRTMTASVILGCLVISKPPIQLYILTKDATFIDDIDFMKELVNIRKSYRKYVHFGFTLTGRDDMEPNASTNIERIKAMGELHKMGFKTFASIEPVIDWESSYRAICLSLAFCDHYKLGLRSWVKKDYYDKDESRRTIRKIVELIASLGGSLYLKNSTRQLMKEIYTEEEYATLLSKTVDMYGEPYRKE